MLFSLYAINMVMFVNILKWCHSQEVPSEEAARMTGPPKHRGVFYKQPKSSNKTIPVCERPGEEMIVFDVDHTLWPFEVDSDPRFKDPFVVQSFDNGTVTVGGRPVEMFPEVVDTLTELSEKGYVLAAIALTNSSSKIMALLNAFDVTKHFKFMEMATEPDKLTLIKLICARSGISMEDVLFFEKDPGEVVDMTWYHVIVYSVDEKGLTKSRARKGLNIFDIRPREERRKHGQQKVEKKEKSNKNKSRPAYERDGTEVEGFNETKIEYIDR